MSFDLLKKQSFREEVTLVEILLDQNNIFKDFSSDPNSYNTPKTTEDDSAYHPQNPKKSYVFSDQRLKGVTFQYFPNLVSASTTTPVLSIGENIGSRASVSIVIDDFVSNDTYELPFPYNDRRVTGSFWGKMVARNFIRNRIVKVYRGYDPDNFDPKNFQIETYIIKDIKRNKNGGITISGVDPLFFTNETKAKMPVKSTGKLDLDYTLSDTSIDVFTEDLTEYGSVGDTGTIRINRELINYEVSSTSANVVTMAITRGDFDTIPSDHKQGDLVQLCYVANERNVVDIIRDALAFTSIDPDVIPDAQWDEEKAKNLSQYNLTNVISKPTEVKKVISDMIRHCGGYIYWDSVASKIILKGNPEFTTPDLVVDESIYEQDSVTVAELSAKQVTRAAINFAKRNYVDDDNESNYRSGVKFVDDVAESDALFAQSYEADLINSNWLTGSAADTQIALQVVSRDVTRKSRIPFETKFLIDSEYIGIASATQEVGEGAGWGKAFNPLEFGNGGSGYSVGFSNGFGPEALDVQLLARKVWLGSTIEMKNHLLIAPNGKEKIYSGQVTKIQRTGGDKWEVTIVSINSEVREDADYIIDTNYEDLTLTDIAPPIQGRATIVSISSGVTIGATSTSNPALVTGSYPDGLILINRGAILGAGGKGGDSGVQINGPGGDTCDVTLDATNGADGGPALEITANTEVTLDNTGSGLIYGGGGGGAGLIGYGTGFGFMGILGDSVASLAGTGGQGYVGGLGGLQYYFDEDNRPPENAPSGDQKGPGFTGWFTGSKRIPFPEREPLPVTRSGGAYGERGEDAVVSPCSDTVEPQNNPPVARIGGAGGKAIILNGNDLLITNGNNDIQIKGAVE